MSVVRRRWDADRTSASSVQMAQIVGDRLQFVLRELVVVSQNVVVSWTAGTLNTVMAAQEEIELARMRDDRIDHCAWRNVLAFTALIRLIAAEKSSMMTFLKNDESDFRREILASDRGASVFDAFEFFFQNLRKLSFGHAISIDNDTLGLRLRMLVKGVDAFLYSFRQIDHVFVTMFLHQDASAKSSR